MAKILCVLYPDPVTGYPPVYARDSIPEITSYPGGQTAPTPEAIDFIPGQLLGCVSGELGLRRYLEAAGHELVVTQPAVGDEIAAAADLVKGKANGTPVAVVRGLGRYVTDVIDPRGAQPLIRDAAHDMFRVGSDEAWNEGYRAGLEAGGR